MFLRQQNVRHSKAESLADTHETSKTQEHCGGHIKGERCELCAPDPEDRELDASEIHDVSPAADGSLLKQVTTAGRDAGPQ